MKILVTGGAGFIGSHVVDKLIEDGHEVIVIDDLSTGSRRNLNTSAKLYEKDILDSSIENIFAEEKPEGMIHLAAQANAPKSMREAVFDSTVNIIGTIKLLENCEKHGVKKVVYASSAAVYGTPVNLPIKEDHPVNPISNYGISKHTPEHFLKVFSESNGTRYMVLRFANVYGPRQDPHGEGGVVSVFLDRILGGKPVHIYGDGKQTRDFIYVGDVADACVKALTEPVNEIVNISTSVQTEVIQLFNVIKELTGIKAEPIYMEKRAGDIVHSYLENSKAKRLMGWEPKYDLSAGLNKTVSWFKDMGDKIMF